MARSALTGAKLGAEDLGEGADVELAVMGNRAGQGSRVPQLTGSTPPDASGAMAIPQDLWHRTSVPASTSTRPGRRGQFKPSHQPENSPGRGQIKPSEWGQLKPS